MYYTGILGISLNYIYDSVSGDLLIWDNLQKWTLKMESEIFVLIDER